MNPKHKFFVPREQISGDKVALYGTDMSHIKNVLRLKEGDSINVMSDPEAWLTVQISEIRQDEIEGEIISSKKMNLESPVKIHLGQTLLKGKKFDAILRKSIELGVASITPLTSERSVVKVHGEQASKKIERWKRIAQESSKQCGRNCIPRVAEKVESFENFCQQNYKKDLKLVFWELEENCLLKDFEINSFPRSIAALIGPEGGFSQAEIECARGYGFKVVSLGPRILRAETAPVVALALLQFQWGDI